MELVIHLLEDSLLVSQEEHLTLRQLKQATIVLRTLFSDLVLHFLGSHLLLGEKLNEN